MDANTIVDYIREKNVEYSTMSHHEVLNTLLYKEYKEIEELKDDIFKKRLDYFVLANCLKEAMVIQTGYKQLKRYFIRHIGMDERKAGVAATKYNKASRAYKKINVIVENIAAHPKIDIRDLSIKELQLAVRMDWVRRRAALITEIGTNTGDVNVQNADPVDSEDVQQSAQLLFSSEWFEKAKNDPNLVTYIMNELSGQVVRRSEYISQR